MSERKIMREQEIMREAITARGINQGELAKLAGYNAQSSISSRLYGKSMRVDTFIKLLNAMGFSVKVEGLGHTWEVAGETKSLDKVAQLQETEKVE
jgi:transcriptional regulator with XRE-family HTH domain